MKINNIIKCFNTSFLQSLYPKQCIGCGEIIENYEYLCQFCKRDIKRINAKKRCFKCGLEKDDCVCKERVYYFEKVICVFEYDDIAKQAILRYKIGRKSHYGEFFAKQMAKAVTDEYKGINFDFICAVPASNKSKRKYGFDHTKRLCEIMSGELKIPMFYEILGCNKKGADQHLKGINERFSNVSGKYFYTRKINCKNVLLIDDIKTTGATLSECAKQLLFAGADTVYCVSALTHIPHKYDDDAVKEQTLITKIKLLKKWDV